MFRWVELCLQGGVTDPVVYILVGAAAMLVFTTMGAIIAVPTGISVVALGVRSRPWIRLALPFVFAALIAAVLFCVGLMGNIDAWRGISSWVVTLFSAVGFGIGWWVAYTGSSEKITEHARVNPFQDDERFPFGHLSPSEADVGEPDPFTEAENPSDEKRSH